MGVFPPTLIFGGSMSLLVIPIVPTQRSSAAAGSAKPPEKPKTFLDIYFDAMYKGAKMDSMPCRSYCKWQWKLRDPDTFGKTRKVFTRECRIDCARFKDLSHASHVI